MLPKYGMWWFLAPNNIWLVFPIGGVSVKARCTPKVSWRQGNRLEKKLKIYVKRCRRQRALAIMMMRTAMHMLRRADCFVFFLKNATPPSWWQD
jgi:hypothetical protein